MKSFLGTGSLFAGGIEALTFGLGPSGWRAAGVEYGLEACSVGESGEVPDACPGDGTTT